MSSCGCQKLIPTVYAMDGQQCGKVCDAATMNADVSMSPSPLRAVYTPRMAPPPYSPRTSPLLPRIFKGKKMLRP